MSRHRKSTSNEFETLIILLGLGSAVTLLIPYLLQFVHRNQLLIFLIVIGFIILLVPTLFILLKFVNRKQKLNLSLAYIDNLSGREFEIYISKLLTLQGFQVKVTGGVNKGDYGVDLVAQKNGVKTAIQTKRWQDVVGIEAVYQAVAGSKYYHCDKAMVITNSHFTLPAINLARANNCQLIDRQTLSTWLTEANKTAML